MQNFIQFDIFISNILTISHDGEQNGETWEKAEYANNS